MLRGAEIEFACDVLCPSLWAPPAGALEAHTQARGPGVSFGSGGDVGPVPLRFFLAFGPKAFSLHFRDLDWIWCRDSTEMLE